MHLKLLVDLVSLFLFFTVQAMSESGSEWNTTPSVSLKLVVGDHLFPSVLG